MNLQPLGDRLIVEALDEEEMTASGIVLPDTAKEKPQRGRVLAVGPGPRDEDGEYVKMDLEPGDEIIFSSPTYWPRSSQRRRPRARRRSWPARPPSAPARQSRNRNGGVDGSQGASLQ